MSAAGEPGKRILLFEYETPDGKEMEGELTSILPGEQKKIEAVLIQASIHPVAIQEFKKNPGEWESFLRLLPEEIQKGIEPIKIFVITPEIKERDLKAIARNIYDRLGGYQSNEIRSEERR